MVKFFKSLVWSVLRLFNLAAPVQLLLKSSLKEDGWFKSYKLQQSIDNEGNPIAWYSYCCLKFLEPRLKKNFQVFEYGSGNSTLWYATEVAKVVSVEHDKKWAEFVASKLPNNAQLFYKELQYGGEYSKMAKNTKLKYHIIAIDGRDRINCIIESIDSLTDDGVYIFDNSQEKQYEKAVNFLIANNFKRIDFYGMLPIVAHENCTSIFYRQNNCLGI